MDPKVNSKIVVVAFAYTRGNEHIFSFPDVRYDKIFALLEARGLAAETVVWNDPSVDWKRFGLVILTPALEFIDVYEEMREVRI